PPLRGLGRSLALPHVLLRSRRLRLRLPLGFRRADRGTTRPRRQPPASGERPARPTMTIAEHPVGVFDSGLGGLSIAREIRARLPAEDILYIADSAYCPYGGRPLDEIRERSVTVTKSLVEAGAKLV